jgi:CHAT domain-containing protein
LRFINLNDNGIAHIIGHGNLKLEKDRQSYTNYLQSNQLKKDLIGNQRIKTDLFILNLCFGAYKRSMFYPDRDLQNQLISKGAKAVIASPYQTIDQSSAYIFEKFYHYLFKGETVEDALQLAKLDYLKTHTGIEAHPQYWSTYELTSNVKDLRLAPEPIPYKSWQAYLVLLVLTAIVLRFYLYWED